MLCTLWLHLSALWFTRCVCLLFAQDDIVCYIHHMGAALIMTKPFGEHQNRMCLYWKLETVRIELWNLSNTQLFLRNVYKSLLIFTERILLEIWRTIPFIPCTDLEEHYDFTLHNEQNMFHVGYLYKTYFSACSCLYPCWILEVSSDIGSFCSVSGWLG